MSISYPKTLTSLRAQWRHNAEGKGAHCPVCDRWGKVYKRRLNPTMLASLAWLKSVSSISTPSKWVDVQTLAPKSVLRTKQLASLRWWGLVEPCKTGEGKGLWRLTLLGWDFLVKKASVHEYVHVYNSEVLWASGDLVQYDETKTEGQALARLVL
jgi:hypothetical protein